MVIGSGADSEVYPGLNRRVKFVVCMLWLVSAAVQVHAVTDPHEGAAAPLSNEPIVPLPLTVDVDPAKVRLGKRLFHDVRLAHDNRMACATCHRLAEGGADGLPRSLGRDGKPLDFNSPTVFNAALNFRQGWRGNYRTLEEQAEAGFLDPQGMNTNWQELLAKLRADPDYREAFAASYRGDLQPAQVLDAIAVFERSLLTPNARFDRYLRGQHDALTEEEKHGYQLFKAYGCVACHQGVNVGGNLFQKFGIFQDNFAERGNTTKADLGRFTITGDKRDRYVFRVPSLRNVAVTAPYFHDGGAPTLKKAVAVMARTQLGRTLTEAEISLIVQFLHTLTGEYQGRSLEADPLP
jgi:cytochrome c peroxidase